MTYFRANHVAGEEKDPWDFLDAAPETPPPLPLTDTKSEEDKASVASAATTQSAPAVPVSGVSVGIGAKTKSQPKILVQKDRLDDLCSTDEAIRICPQNPKALSETGIPDHLLVQREQTTTVKGGSLYLCHHKLCQDPPYYAQSTTGLYSHVRQKHLGMVVACPYCPKKLFWNTKRWGTHMERHHRDLPHFGLQLMDEAAVATALLSKKTWRLSRPWPRNRRRGFARGYIQSRRSPLFLRGSLPVPPPPSQRSLLLTVMMAMITNPLLAWLIPPRTQPAVAVLPWMTRLLSFIQNVSPSLSTNSKLYGRGPLLYVDSPPSRL